MKTIISMAREAGITIPTRFSYDKTVAELERFATLVKAAHTAELLEGVQMPEPVAWELFFYNGNSQGYTGNKGEAAEFGEEADTLFTADQLRETVAAAVLREREACAAMVEDQILNYSESYVIDGCAAAIRNRSNT